MSSDKKSEIICKCTFEMDCGISMDELYREKKKIIEKLARESILKRRVLRPFLAVFTEIESQGEKVSDIVIGVDTFNNLRKYAKDEIDINNIPNELKKRFFGSMWEAMIWIAPRNPKGVYAFKENSKKFEEMFPEVFKCKVELFLGDKR